MSHKNRDRLFFGIDCACRAIDIGNYEIFSENVSANVSNFKSEKVKKWKGEKAALPFDRKLFHFFTFSLFHFLHLT
jgi:hypothetical protein